MVCRSHFWTIWKILLGTLVALGDPFPQSDALPLGEPALLSLTAEPLSGTMLPGSLLSGDMLQRAAEALDHPIAVRDLAPLAARHSYANALWITVRGGLRVSFASEAPGDAVRCRFTGLLPPKDLRGIAIYAVHPSQKLPSKAPGAHALILLDAVRELSPDGLFQTPVVLLHDNDLWDQDPRPERGLVDFLVVGASGR